MTQIDLVLEIATDFVHLVADILELQTNTVILVQQALLVLSNAV